jgi:UDP-4-amino-4-deoxy-L-arabinose formyltransferase/UDP-glucuronic acid dehydrogenase (UDP-4-keto-hexauronic acid decarboxylating)
MGLAGLEALSRHKYDIVEVFTHKDDPHENCWFGSVKNWAENHNIPVDTMDEINSPQGIGKIARHKPDMIFSFYYRKMIANEILAIPKLGAFNLHGSFLPHYRGRCPVNWVLINGEKKTGVTLHYMIDKPDAGDIVGQREVIIDSADTAKTLYDKLCIAAELLMEKMLPVMKKGLIPRVRQNLAQGSYYGGRKPEDGRIDWSKTDEEIYNLIRAVTEPYPGAFAHLENGEKIILWKALPGERGHCEVPGTVDFLQEEVLVQTGKNAVKLLEIEVGGSRISDKHIGSYLSSRKVTKLK